MSDTVFVAQKHDPVREELEVLRTMVLAVTLAFVKSQPNPVAAAKEVALWADGVKSGVAPHVATAAWAAIDDLVRTITALAEPVTAEPHA